MAVPIAARMTAEDFDAFALRPENMEKRLELVVGEVIERLPYFTAAVFAANFTVYVGLFVYSNQLGYLTGASGGYIVLGNRVMPRMAFISYARQSRLPVSGYVPNPPDLVIEVLADPENAVEQRTLRIKISTYLAAGTVVWVVDWRARQVEVYTPGQGVAVYGPADTLEGGAVLPGFALDLSEVFPTSAAT